MGQKYKPGNTEDNKATLIEFLKSLDFKESKKRDKWGEIKVDNRTESPPGFSKVLKP